MPVYELRHSCESEEPKRSKHSRSSFSFTFSDPDLSHVKHSGQRQPKVDRPDRRAIALLQGEKLISGKSRWDVEGDTQVKKIKMNLNSRKKWMHDSRVTNDLRVHSILSRWINCPQKENQLSQRIAHKRKNSPQHVVDAFNVCRKPWTAPTYATKKQDLHWG